MEDKDDKGIWQSMKRHPIMAGCAIMLLLMLCLGGACMMGIITKPASAAVLQFDNPYCRDYTWDAATKKVTCVPATIPPIDPPPEPTDPPPTLTCPSDALRINGKWGENNIRTTGFNNQWLVIEVKPPAGWSSNSAKTSSWVEYIDGSPVRSAMFATQPCTFDTQYALKSGNGSIQRINDQLGFTFKYKTGSPDSYSVVLEPGKTYYINAKNIWWATGQPSCNGSCNMQGALPQ